MSDTIIAALIGAGAAMLAAVVGPSLAEMLREALARMRNAPPERDDSLVEKIVAAVAAGKLTGDLTAKKVAAEFDGYSPAHTQTVLANFCEETGYWVKRGQRARFVRVARGRYRVKQTPSLKRAA
ncbi:hypothetical protein U91I_00462 [alpha proteobacterium U9-1i]|nr:hypothetical protein U91I_00462 [alpha proteobacterium U9-1i]